MSTYLVISPHLDDAVLSCGAQIASWTADGHTVFVATVFNMAAESHAQHYAQRIHDNETAIALLGAKAIYLNFMDAPFRNPAFHNFSTILLHDQLPATALEVTTTLGPILQMVVHSVVADAVYFPLAIGGHVDHLIVYACSKQYWKTNTPVYYYEDLPYALVPGWRTVRWLQHGAVPASILPAKDLPPTRLQDIPLAFLKNYMSGEADRQTSEALHAAQQAALLPAMAGACSWTLTENVFHVNKFTFDQSYFRQKIAAIRCYTSEWPVLFGPTEKDIVNSLGQPGNPNGYTEIYWTLK
ncbi:N-acetylglucosaminyl deacetylase, LmbE family [Chitinophaga costaii]|uniref:N-acetylglucosaminyl deacetylase, LmbE family n=1 Tax=Chitinophaga costaii TaxID=1335309 RepID=A0A1C3ZWY8_9BACT|nr:PIG-L family deacetylase [Chitinophaga costaii]PUZ30539.1 PIG-L family deacetylase [Chitinophaga costaii]SCB86889.1 N-acetylglucosaminyl deacetylase, LmbE family [Chitinophaga costaii]